MADDNNLGTSFPSHRFFSKSPGWAECLDCGQVRQSGRDYWWVVSYGVLTVASTMENPTPTQGDPERCVETKKPQIECPLRVPVLGTTPVGMPPGVLADYIETVPDGQRDQVVDDLAHLSPADRESARRLNEALVEDDGRETPAAGRYFADWIWPKRL